MMSKDATPVAESVEVTQADREAAANAVKAYRDTKNGDWQQRIRDGKCDDGEMAQAFARHRLAAYEAGRAEGVREAAEYLEARANKVDPQTGKRLPMVDQHTASVMRASATAIRALSKEPTK